MKGLEELFTTEELAAYFKVDPEVIFRLVAKAAITHYKIGKSLRFRVSEVEAYLKRVKVGGGI